MLPSIKIFSIWPHANRQKDIHTRLANAVTLVWSSLRLAPITSLSVANLKDIDSHQHSKPPIQLLITSGSVSSWHIFQDIFMAHFMRGYDRWEGSIRLVLQLNCLFQHLHLTYKLSLFLWSKQIYESAYQTRPFWSQARWHVQKLTTNPKFSR